MAPMARNYAPDFIPNETNAAYYARRVEHVGLVISEASFIDHPVSSGHKGQPAIFGGALDGYKKVITAVHAVGGKMFCQLWHMGPERPDGGIPNPELPAVSPSGLRDTDKPHGVALSLQDIKEVQQSYVRAAVDAKAIGFDGIEIHGAHGYLIHSFISQRTNKRNDQYGGSFENRLRFGVELLEMVRDAVGPRYPISFRTSQWSNLDYGGKIFDSPKDIEIAAKRWSEAGADIFHCSTRRFWEPEFPDSELNLAGWFKALSDQTVIGVGSVGLSTDFTRMRAKQVDQDASFNAEANLEALVERIEKREFDLIAVGRAHITNPDWAAKVRRGDLASIKPFDVKDLKGLV